MKSATRKRVVALLARRRERLRNAEAAHRGVLASYSRLHDDFMDEKRKVADLQRRLDRLVDGHVDTDYRAGHEGDVCCSWRVSRVVLKCARDRGVVWDEVMRKLRQELIDAKV